MISKQYSIAGYYVAFLKREINENVELFPHLYNNC